MNLIASEQIIYQSPSSADVFCYSPDLIRLPSGRLLAGFDLGGPGVVKLPGVKTTHGDCATGNQGKIFASDDDGATWQHMADLPMYHARFIVDGNTVYFLGHDKAITISASTDGGCTWGPVSEFEGQFQWHQSPCAVHYEEDAIYLTMEIYQGAEWPAVSIVMMRGKRGTDLTRRENWELSNEFKYPENLPSSNGVPFFEGGTCLCPDAEKDKRYCGPPCFLESHVVKLHSDRHLLHEQDTLHIICRQHSGITNLAALLKCRIAKDAPMEISLVHSPVGSPMLHIPFPGGHMKFHVIFDEISQLYWLVSSQSTDSMTRPELLPDNRYGLPDNERHRLALYFSSNLIDWCFAGMVAVGENALISRHYASMIVNGNDLLILSRSGNENARSAHNGNMLTLHRVKDFRNLVY